MRASIAIFTMAVVVHSNAANAQSVAETVISAKSAVVIEAVNGQNVGKLARAANVPMGIELVPQSAARVSIRTAGRRLREVLDQMVAADPRYEWREVDGVVVLRTASAWSSVTSTLQFPVHAMSLRNIDGADAITAMALMVGHKDIAGSLAESRTFSVDVPEGATFLEALNAMVRAHGSLAWTVARTDGRDKTFVATIMMFSGSSGMGFSVRSGSLLASEPIVFERPEVNETGRHLDLSQVIPPGRNGTPFETSGIGTGIVSDLARAMRIPMGIEALPPPSLPPRPVMRVGELLPPLPELPPEPPPKITLSGMTLAAALADLTLLDPRYQWREMNGVIVFRPVAAWTNAKSPLARHIEGFRLMDAVLQDVVRAFQSRLGLPGAVELTDARRFSIDLPAGPIVDALNAIVRSHGMLSWQWEPSDETDLKFHPQLRHRVTFGFASGSGVGVLVP